MSVIHKFDIINNVIICLESVETSLSYNTSIDLINFATQKINELVKCELHEREVERLKTYAEDLQKILLKVRKNRKNAEEQTHSIVDDIHSLRYRMFDFTQMEVDEEFKCNTLTQFIKMLKDIINKLKLFIKTSPLEQYSEGTPRGF
jgi:predicted nuclease with TOPRIM domain